METDELDQGCSHASQLAGSGNSDKNRDNYQSARNQLESFLASKQLPSVDLVEESVVCSQTLLGEYGTYLADHGRKANGDLLKGNTAYQYFMYTKTFLERKYPDNSLLKQLNESEGYTKVGGEIKKKVLRRCIREGIPFSEKAPALLRNDLITFCRRFLDENRPESLMKRAALVINWLAVGRAGEVALMSWNCLLLPTDADYLIADWAQQKTSSFQMMSFFPDRTHYEIDYLHSLASYLLATRSRNGERSFIFPELQAVKAPATKLTAWLKEKDVQQVDYRGTSLRIGATNQLANTRGVELHHIIARGGWDFEGVNNVFHYLLQILQNVNVGGRALSGWSDCKSGAYLPRLVFMNTENAATIDRLLYFLFGAYLVIFQENPKITGLLHAMLASLLMYYEDVYADWGKDSFIIQQIATAATDANIDYKCLLEWGRAVKKDFKSRNIDNVESTEMLDQVQQLRKENVELRDNVSQMAIALTEVRDLLRKQEIDQVPRSPSGPERVSPRRKRCRSIDVDTVEGDAAADELGETAKRVPVKSLNDALIKKPSVQKEFEIHGLSNYYLSQFLADYIKQGLFNEGTLQQVCTKKQLKSSILVVMKFVKENVDLTELLESRHLNLSDTRVLTKIDKIASDIEKQVISKLSALEQEQKQDLTGNTKQRNPVKKPLMSGLAKRIEILHRASRLVGPKTATLFDAVAPAKSASQP
eukprot:gb/GECG01013141.1/.p1 GENE.gb/GECG01013141.1/~~gb/GECG01013141.1/.p1  ORF type:complete len:705 (+),score=90.99 gb/GECG01013141.1/:1-2115(+)